MEIFGKITLRVLMTVALLAVVGLVALPGVSRAQSALQVVAQEGSGSSSLEGGSELRITNPTALPLCALVYFYETDGDFYGCYSYLVPPFGSLDDDDCEGECYNPLSNDSGEGSIFIVSGQPLPNTGLCSDTNVKPKAGLRSWLMIDENGAVGVSAQDAVLGSDVLRKLIGDCASY